VILNLGSINWLAVVVAAVVGLVIGFVYYAPQLMGRRWAASAGATLPSGTPPAMTLVGTIVSVLITAVALGVLASATGATGNDGAALGFICWLGFVLTWTVSGALYERRSWTYVWITALQGLISLLVMGAIIGYWQ
jgi:hypothetical protein